MTRKIKILQILPELNTEKFEDNTLELAKLLVQSGYDSYVLSNGGKLQEALEKDGSKHITMTVHKKSLFSFITVFKIRALLLKEEFDIIHLHSRLPGCFFYQAYKQIPPHKRPKLVTTFNSYYAPDFDSRIISKGDAIICPSKSVRNFVLENYRSTRHKALKVIYKGIDTKKFPYGFQPNPKWLQQWNNENHSLNDKFTITLPGNITSRKGHFDFLHILYYLKRDGIPVHGLIIGSVHSKNEEYLYRLKYNIRKLELSNDISILLNRKDLREIITVSDLVVSCSIIPEVFDKTCLMALSLGVPVVAYSHGVLKEHLKTLYPYGIIEANKKSSMRLKIREFYGLEEKPKPLKNKTFTKQGARQQIVSIYERLLVN